MTLKHQGTLSINTKRLLLRKYRQGDEQQMFDNFLSDSRVTEHVNWETHTSLKTTEDFLQMHLKQYQTDNSFYGWGIEMNGTIIGSIGAFHLDDSIKSCEIGYSMGSRFWGQGIITEAVTAVCGFLFNEIGFNRITASYNEENAASGKVMKKVGMSYEGTCKEAALRKDGTFGNLILYAILKSDIIDNFCAPISPALPFPTDRALYHQPEKT